jgi:phosphatidylinositol alpha-1,6-mannosyltransferase
MERLVLGVFPGLGGPNAGGIQAYGRLAWQAVATHTHAQGGSAGLLVYGQADASDLVLGDASSFAAASKWRVLRAALTRTWRAPLVCFWHLHLLRLLPLLRVGPAKVVLFLNGIEAWCDPGTILRRLLQRVDLFLSISDFTWRRFLEFHPQLADRPHRTVHLGLEEPTAEVESPEDPPAALILGRIVRQEDYKGHRELIRIWPRVLQRIPKARLWIVGDGDLRPDLEQLSHELKVADFVRFWGRVDENSKQELLRRCRCLTMPSRGEGFGLVYLEAMRLGRPCLVSRSDAGGEVVNPPEAGLAADPHNAEELTEAVCRLLTAGPEWNQWSRGARQRYESRFTAAHFQERLLHTLFPERASLT